MSQVRLQDLLRDRLGVLQVENIPGLMAALDAKVAKTSISNAVNSTSTTNVGSSSAVKVAYDKGVEALSRANAAYTLAQDAANATTNLPNSKSDSVSLADSNTLATSMAVKTTYDRAEDGRTRAINAQTKADAAYDRWANLPNAKSDSTTFDSSASLATSKAVKVAYDAVLVASQRAAQGISDAAAARSYADALFNNRSDSVSSTSSTTLATSKAVKTAYDKLESDLYYGSTSRAQATSAGINVNGILTVSSTISAGSNITAYSDRRLKDNIQKLAGVWDKLDGLNGYSFNWKNSGRPSIGVIAQEVQAVLPELVVEIDGDLTVDYGLLAALLIEAVKDLKAQIDAK